MPKRKSCLVAYPVGIPQRNQSVSQKEYKPLCGEGTKPIFILCRLQIVTSPTEILLLLSFCLCEGLIVELWILFESCWL